MKNIQKQKEDVLSKSMLMVSIISLITIFSTSVSYALSEVGKVTNVGRYSTIENEPTQAQLNPLLGIQQMHFPTSINTIGEAVDYWLRHTGYNVSSIKNQSIELKDIFKQKLPHVQRELGPISVRSGLTTLVGQDVFNLIQDPIHRKVNFELKKEYSKLFKSTNGKRA